MEQLLPFLKINYHIDAKHNVFTVKTTPVFDYKDIVVHYGNLMIDKHYYAGLNGLYDFSQLEHITGDCQMLLDTAEVMNNPQVVKRPSKTAIVLPESNGEACEVMARFCRETFQSMNQFRLFSVSDIAKVEQFLSLPTQYHKLAKCA